jgi:hypothetical protein
MPRLIEDGAKRDELCVRFDEQLEQDKVRNELTLGTSFEGRAYNTRTSRSRNQAKSSHAILNHLRQKPFTLSDIR